MLANAYSLVEEDDLLFRCESLQRICDLHVYLELDDFAQLADHYVIADMETEEELAEDALVLNDLIVDRLNHDCKHGWMLKAEVLKLYFPLSCGSKVT